MPKLQKIYDKGFTTIGNQVLEDIDLTFKAKGLFVYMWSRPDNWQFYVSELVKHAKDKRDAVMTAISELESHGYLLRSRDRNALGQLTNKNTWLLSCSPQASWIKQNQNKKSKKTQIASKTPKASKPKTEKSIQPKSENPMLEKPTLENPTLPITDLTNYLNKEITDSLSLSSPSCGKTIDDSYQQQIKQYEREEKTKQIIYLFNQKAKEWMVKVNPISNREVKQLSRAIGNHSLNQIKPLVETAIVNAQQYQFGYLLSMIKNLPEEAE